MKTFSNTVAGLLLAAGCGAASAMAVAGAAPGDGSHARPNTAAAAPTAPSLDLVAGRLDQVDAARHSITVGGRVLALHPTQLGIFRDGGQRGTLASLQPGQRIRFALEPGAAEPRRVVLIYIGLAP